MGSAPWRRMSSWPDSPVHRLAEAGAYIVTCGTYMKRNHFQISERLRLLYEALQRLAAKYGWNLQAWAVFSNRYLTTLRSNVTRRRLKSPFSPATRRVKPPGFV
jgi:hypothetical protein